MKKHAEKIKYAQFLIDCVKKAISGQSKPSFFDGFDFDFFWQLSSEHSMANFMYCVLREESEFLKDKSYEKFKNEYKMCLYREAAQELESQKLSEVFCKADIDFMFLKGSILKYLYPSPDMRTMCDIDILIRPSDLEKAEKIMLSLDYKKSGEALLHHSYRKGKLLLVEIHKSLIDEGLSPYYDYYKDPFSKACVCGENKNRYEFCDEDFYIFLIVHLAKHYRYGGTGIRSVVDVYVYLKNKENLNFSYIKDELEKLKLAEFHKNITKLISYWFDGAQVTPVIQYMSEYIISSGVYGKGEAQMLNAFVSDEKGKSKLGYILRTIFPGKKYMSLRYPVIEKNPLLLPLFWVVRWIQTLLCSRGSLRYRLAWLGNKNKREIMLHKQGLGIDDKD